MLKGLAQIFLILLLLLGMLIATVSAISYFSFGVMGAIGFLIIGIVVVGSVYLIDRKTDPMKRHIIGHFLLLVFNTIGFGLLLISLLFFWWDGFQTMRADEYFLASVVSFTIAFLVSRIFRPRPFQEPRDPDRPHS